MRALVVLLLLATRAQAIDCPSPKLCIDGCDSLPATQLAGPPTGLGLQVSQDNACQWEQPINFSVKKVNKQGCFDTRCTLGIATTQIIGGAPSPGASCLVCTAVTGTTCTALAWAACTVSTTTTATTTSSTTTT